MPPSGASATNGPMTPSRARVRARKSSRAASSRGHGSASHCGCSRSASSNVVATCTLSVIGEASTVRGERYAVVSCHVERPLDDRVWNAFASLHAAAPGGFRIAALLRPPEPAEDERTWLDLARAAAERGPLGHHTHFGGVEDARPPAGVDPVARFWRELEWLRQHGVAPRFYCGGGWFMDEALAGEVARAGYVDCS